MIPPGARRVLAIFTVLACIAAVAPVVVIVLESFTSTDYVVFPPQGFSLKWYGEFLKRREFVESALISLLVALGASIGSTVLGTMIAIALLRYPFFGSRALQSLFMAPLSLPGIILGLALLQSFAHYGLPRNMATLMFAHIVVTLPFVIRFVSVALLGVGQDVERAAMSLGADQWRTFRHVTLPLIRPGAIASLVFTFILSFDEVAASIFIASPSAMTLPVRIFAYIEQNYDPLITAVSSLLVFAAIVALVIVERTTGMAKLFGLR